MKDIVLPALIGIAVYWLILLRWALKRETTIRNHLVFWIAGIGAFLALSLLALAKGEEMGAELTRGLSFLSGLLVSAFVDRKNIRRRDSSYW
jgi:hypothetical protein